MEVFAASGHGGRPLPCVLHGDASRTALVLPGAARAGNRLGGTPARPDLHFTRALLQEQGLSVLEVWWDADEADAAELEDWLLENARGALGALAEQGREPALLVARSLGSVALALLRREEPPRVRLPSVWIAPLMHREPVRESLLHGGGPCFVLCGGRDAAYDAGLATLLHRRDADVLVLEHADHGLDCGDAVLTARALAGALEQLRDFLRRSGTS
jgi:hypothetical protein